jgi:CRISPR-associated protein Csb2
MLAFGIRYLNGFAAASEPDSHDRAEWPPHPGRVFMALAAAHFHTGADPAEREALRWLEGLSHWPTIRAAEHIQRALVTHFVPVNDRAGETSKPPTAPIQSAPQLARSRQPRTFARAFLDDDVVYVSWPGADPPASIRRALEVLCGKVTRIGHSSSLVQMWLAGLDEVGEPSWVPDDARAALHLRVAGPGTFEDLERRYNYGAVERYAALQVAAYDDADQKAQKEARRRLKEEFSDRPPPQLRPELPLSQGYARPAPAQVESVAAGSVFSPHLTVLALEPDTGPYRHLDFLCVLQVVKGWREAILSHANDPPDRVRHVLSGHDRDGAPLEGPHLAFVPLGFVGHQHADGRLLGMGLALPDGLSAEERRHALRAVGCVRHLLLGRLGTWRIVPVSAARPPWNLRPEVWTAHPDGATHWSTVTPVAFDRHPKTDDRAAYQREVASMIGQACVRVGLPQPREVVVTPVSAHLGVPPAHAFRRLRRKDGGERRHAHAIIIFDRPVRGPILLGAGRYRGYGFCRPMRDGPGPEKADEASRPGIR